MKRRDFIKTAALATAGVIVSPYILPTGRLFARSGSRIANHVIFVLFGGGLRNQETVDLMYLAGQQGQSTTGNIMNNMLAGSKPGSKLVYTPWAPVLGKPLAQQGTLFKEVRYSTGPTGHFNGHTVAMTGNYTNTGLNLNINPDYPTVFEYYRKHYDPARSAINAWWLSEGLGPYTALNYSRHPEYGPQYGANYFSPLSTFYLAGQQYFQNIPDYQPDDLQRIQKMRSFLDQNFDKSGGALPGIQNTDQDREQIEQFIKDTVKKTFAGQMEWPLPNGATTDDLTGDLVNVAYAWEVMQKFQPELMVINTINSDVCHNDFSSYIGNMHKADYGIGWLWSKIQSDPVLKDDTIMICMPEHGRNLAPNTLRDRNGLAAFDHTSDDNSRRVFALVAGPPGKVQQNQVLGTMGQPVGESIDIVPTIAHILGFKDQIPSGMLPGRVLTEAFA